MRKLAVLLAIVILASCGQGGNKTAKTKTFTAPADWKTFAQDKYSIQYPPTWTLKPGEGSIPFTITAQPDSANPLNIEVINMTSRDMMGQNIDLDALSKMAAEQLKNVLTNFTMISQKKLTDEDGDYEQVIFSGDQYSIGMTYEQLYRPYDGKIYILTLTTPKDKWAKSQQLGENILSTFTVKK